MNTNLQKKILIAEKKTKSWAKGKDVNFSNNQEFGLCSKCGKELDKKHYSKKPICFDCLMDKQRNYAKLYNRRKRVLSKKTVMNRVKKE